LQFVILFPSISSSSLISSLNCFFCFFLNLTFNERTSSPKTVYRYILYQILCTGG
jgi:hypothetical protein